jgi:retinol-binding protein 3
MRESVRGSFTTGRFLGALLSVLPSLVFADASAPTIPNTPAGHALSAWLDAFNSGDSARFESFEEAHAPWLSLDRQMGLREHTGGYDLVSIDGSGKLWIVFSVKARVSPTQILGSLVVRSNDPEHISLLDLAPADAKSAEVVLDEAERNRVVEGAARLLQEFYVFPDVAMKAAATLEAQQKRGDYRGITDGEVFAVRLSDDLAAIGGDRHLGVDYFAKDMPPEEPSSRPHPDPRKLAASNCGFEKADHYPPNIGYLKLNAFEEPDLCTSTAVAA